MNAYLLSMAMSPKDENFQPFDVFSTDPGEMRPMALTGVASDSHKDIPGKESHCRAGQIPLTLTDALKPYSLPCQ